MSKKSSWLGMALEEVPLARHFTKPFYCWGSGHRWRRCLDSRQQQGQAFVVVFKAVGAWESYEQLWRSQRLITWKVQDHLLARSQSTCSHPPISSHNPKAAQDQQIHGQSSIKRRCPQTVYNISPAPLTSIINSSDNWSFRDGWMAAPRKWLETPGPSAPTVRPHGSASISCSWGNHGWADGGANSSS